MDAGLEAGRPILYAFHFWAALFGPDLPPLNLEVRILFYSTTMSDDAPNALGLEFSQSAPEVDEPAVFTPASPGSATAETSVRKEKTPYVNPDRFRTGGAQRVCYFPIGFARFLALICSGKEKLTEEALAEKMARIREQNAKIKERRMVSTFFDYVENFRSNYT